MRAAGGGPLPFRAVLAGAAALFLAAPAVADPLQWANGRWGAADAGADGHEWTCERTPFLFEAWTLPGAGADADGAARIRFTELGDGRTAPVVWPGKVLASDARSFVFAYADENRFHRGERIAWRYAFSGRNAFTWQAVTSQGPVPGTELRLRRCPASRLTG